jgi:hypothetical protein
VEVTGAGQEAERRRERCRSVQKSQLCAAPKLDQVTVESAGTFSDRRRACSEDSVNTRSLSLAAPGF